MKIAVATEDGRTVSQHFGRTPYFAIFEIAEGTIVNRSMRENTFTWHFREHHGDQRNEEHHDAHGDPDAHQSIAEGLEDCRVVISQGMGRRAWEDLRGAGIEMIVTDEIEVQLAVQKYLAGELEDRVEKLH